MADNWQTTFYSDNSNKMEKLINKSFEKIIFLFKPHLFKRNIFKLYFYKIFYLIFKKIITSPILINFGQFKMLAYNNNKDLSKFMLKNLNVWDGFQVERINNIFKNKKSLFIDCGCSFGSYSVPIAKLNSTNSKVIAIDASTVATRRLKENVLLNDINNIEIYNLAIGKEEGYANFNEDLNLLPNSGSFRFDSFGKKLRVTTLDIILEQQLLDSFEVIFVKMDLEGYEFDGLLGFKKNIVKYKPIILFEFSRMLLQNTSFSENAFNLFLKETSYEIKDYDNNIYSIEQLVKDMNSKDEKYEILADFLLVSKNN
jgi:FkbM family methyltransferase